MSDMELDIEEALNETMQGIKDKEDPQDEAEETISEDRERDENGRFVTKEEEDASAERDEPDAIEPEPTPEPDSDPEPSADSETATEEAFQSDFDLKNPPSSWSAEAKSKWNDLPDWAKHESQKRETEMTNGAKALYQRAAYGDRLNQVVQPYMPIIQAEGGTPESTVQTMLGVAYTLRQGTMQERLGLIRDVAQQYGFFDDLVAAFANPEVANQPNVGQNNQYRDPRVDDLERRFNARERQQQEVSGQQAAQAVQTFVSATNEDGSLKYPYFANVQQHMATLYESGEYESLETAYDAAVWANPETRSLLLAQQAKEDSEAREEEAKERARKAQQANKLNVQQGGTHAPRQSDKPTGSVDETMRETMADIKARTG